MLFTEQLPFDRRSKRHGNHCDTYFVFAVDSKSHIFLFLFVFFRSIRLFGQINEFAFSQHLKWICLDLSIKKTSFTCIVVHNVFAEIEASNRKSIAGMKRLILLLVLLLNSIRFYNDYYRSASALTNAASENIDFSSNKYFQFEKGNFSE